jgi:hypothetical protein
VCLGMSPAVVCVRTDMPHAWPREMGGWDPPSRHGAANFLKAYTSQALQAKPTMSAGLRSEYQGLVACRAGHRQRVHHGLYCRGNGRIGHEERPDERNQRSVQLFLLTCARPLFSGRDVVPNCAHDCAREGL